MKTLFCKLAIAAIALGFALPVVARAQTGDNDGCTNATLKGDYAFRVSGEILFSDGSITLRNGVAMTHFDGHGNLSQVDFVVSNPPTPGPPPPADPVTNFHVDETGTYTVYPDCTGSAEIDMPPHPGGVVIKLMLVLSDEGHEIHTVVSSLTAPPPPIGRPTIVGVAIQSDAEKLGVAIQDFDRNW